MYQGDLEVMRNSIYARHGYSFRNRRMRFLFDQLVDWYMPVSVNITGELTDLEKKNIDLLKRYEAHAEKYYDVFGRWEEVGVGVGWTSALRRLLCTQTLKVARRKPACVAQSGKELEFQEKENRVVFKPVLTRGCFSDIFHEPWH